MSLAFVVDPNHAILLLMCGILLLYAEFNKPGTVVFGCLGALAVMLAIYGLDQFAIRYAAVAIIVGGVAFVSLGMKFPLRGAIPSLGAGFLVYGIEDLVVAPPVNWIVAIVSSMVFTIVTTWLLRVALQARHNKSLVGPHTMIGKLATVHTPLTPSGQVEIRGELWQAVLVDSNFAAKGASVVVRDMHDLELSVVALQTKMPSVQRE